MTRRVHRPNLVAAFLLLLGCGSPAASDPGPPVQILFIGNSLTSENGLPALVEEMAEALSGRRYQVQALVQNNFSLEDHWVLGTAQATIAEEGRAFVVMQQGPSTLPENRANLIHWAGVFAAAIRAAGAEPAMYGVWPPWGGDWSAGIESYRQAADSIDGLYLPAAMAFQATWARDPRIPLLSLDKFHPSEVGTFLAALTIAARLTGRSAADLPRRFDARFSIPRATGTTLREAAMEAIAAEAP